MKINRVEDRLFSVELTEKEAQTISDHTEVDFHVSALMANRLGTLLFHYMSEACMFPNSTRATLEVDM